MARIEIENRIWADPRFKTFRSLTGLSPAFGVGVLTILWHSSQDMLKETCTETDLRHWFIDEKIDMATLMGGLCEAGFLVKVGEKKFRIAGNRERIERVKIWRENGVAGAKKRWADKRNARQRDAALSEKGNGHPNGEANGHPNGVSMATPMANRTPLANRTPMANRLIDKYANSTKKSSLREDAAVQKSITTVIDAEHECSNDDEARIVSLRVESCDDDSRQNDENVSRIDEKGSRNSGRASGVQNAIAAYCDAFKSKFGHNPEVLGKEASAAKSLVKDLGIEKATKYIRAYLSMNDSWFIKQDYKLSILLGNVNKVKTFVETGMVTTGTVAAQAELSSHNAMVAQQFLNRRSERSLNSQRTLEASKDAAAEYTAPW